MEFIRIAPSKTLLLLPQSFRLRMLNPLPLPPGMYLSGGSKEFLRSRFYSWAATILLLASLGLNVFLYRRQQTLQNLTNTLIRNNSELKSSLKGQSSRLAVYEDTAFKATSLIGTDLSKVASAVVYWNPESNDLFMKVNSLPDPEVGKQYQLWALTEWNPRECRGIRIT